MKSAVILLHGFLTDEKDFGDLPKHLESRYDKVIKAKFPGHGDDGDLKEFIADKTIEYAKNLFDQVALEYHKIDLIGYSMGGAIASYLSSIRKVNRMVLLAPANKYINFTMPLGVLSFYYDTLKKGIRKRLTEDDNGENEDIKFMVDRIKTNHLNNKKALAIGMDRLFPNYNFSTLTNFRKVIKICNKGLKDIPCPTLICWGKLDELVPRKSIDYDYKFISNEEKKKVIFNDVSHLMLKSENSEHLIHEIISFIDSERIRSEVNRYWEEFEENNNISNLDYTETRILLNDINDLNDVVNGIKNGLIKGIALPKKIYNLERLHYPKVGDYKIIKDYYGHPVCIVKTTRVDVIPFGRIGRRTGFIFDDKLLRRWQHIYRREFYTLMKAYKKDFTLNTDTVIEYFEIVYK